MDTVLLFRDEPLSVASAVPSVSLVAAELDAGLPARVVFEPGDGHRYELVIVPLWASSLERYASGRPDRLLVLNSADYRCTRGAVLERGGPHEALIQSGAYDSPWQMTVMAWFLEAHLWPRIAAIRGAVPT